MILKDLRPGERRQLSMLQSDLLGRSSLETTPNLEKAGSGTGSAPVCSYLLHIRQASRVGFQANSPPGTRVIGQEMHRSQPCPIVSSHQCWITTSSLSAQEDTRQALSDLVLLDKTHLSFNTQLRDTPQPPTPIPAKVLLRNDPQPQTFNCYRETESLEREITYWGYIQGSTYLLPQGSQAISTQ